MTSAYSISDLSSEFGVTPRTLRFYEEKGLLQPTRVGQARRYSAADRARLVLVLRGKTLGLSLQESAELIGMYNPATNNREQIKRLIEKIQARRAQLLAQKLELEHLIEDLDAWEKRSNDSIKRRRSQKALRNSGMNTLKTQINSRSQALQRQCRTHAVIGR